MAEQSLIERLRQQYFDNLSERWNTDGTQRQTTAGTAKVPSLSAIIDQYGVVGGANGNIYLGEDEVRRAGLPTRVDFCDQ